MKKIILYSILLTTSFIVFTSCEDIVESEFDCYREPIYYGLHNLTEKTDSFWSFQPNQKRFYTQAGQEVLLKENTWNPYQEEIMERILNSFCGESNTGFKYDYVELESRSVYYENSTNRFARFSVDIQVEPFGNSDNINYVDVMTISGSGFYERFLIDNRDVFENNSFYNTFDFVEDTIVAGKHFQNVYYSSRSSSSSSLFYTKEEGVVAFYDFDGNLYVLDRIE